MLTITIFDVIASTFPNCDDHYLYRFYDGNITFYVGKSTCVEDRLERHLGLYGRRGTVKLINLIDDNTPDSMKWNIDLYTLQDCEQLLDVHLSSEDLDSKIAESETALIKQYCPCLNTANNHNPSILPEKYKKSRERGSHA